MASCCFLLLSSSYNGLVLPDENAPSKEVRSNLNLPVYDRTFTYVMDGRFNLIDNRNQFIEHQRNVNRTEQEAIARGRIAAESFKAKFGSGCDFTNLPDEKYLSGTSMSADGTFSFQPFLVDPAARLRVTSETVRGEESMAYKNAIVSSGGWVVMINKNTMSTGTLKETLNAGDMSLFGDYNIQVWRDCPLSKRKGSRYWQPRRSSNTLKRRCLDDEPNAQGSPAPAINIRYQSRTLARAGNPLVIDCLLESTEWGSGSAIGAIRIIDVPEDGKGPIVSGSSLNKFPADPADGGI